MPDAPPSLSSCFAVLDPTLRLTPVPVTDGVYAELDRRFDEFRGHVLVAEYAFEDDWPGWECHPAGDELVVLLEGSATLRLHQDDGEHGIALSTAGEYAIVPAGIWHTARISGPTRMLFMTPGEGTQHRDSPP